MSETTAYLISKRQFKVGEFKLKVETTFGKLNIINGYYNEDNNWFNAGDNAHTIFDVNTMEENPPFEYVEIHDTVNKRLLPEGIQEPVECKRCLTNVKEDVNDLLFAITEKEFDENRETDMAIVELVCPKCGQISKFSELTYQEEISITNQYVCFVAILENLNEVKLTEIGEQLNTSFEVIYGSI